MLEEIVVDLVKIDMDDVEENIKDELFAENQGHHFVDLSRHEISWRDKTKIKNPSELFHVYLKETTLEIFSCIWYRRKYLKTHKKKI